VKVRHYEGKWVESSIKEWIVYFEEINLLRPFKEKKPLS